MKSLILKSVLFLSLTNILLYSCITPDDQYEDNGSPVIASDSNIFITPTSNSVRIDGSKSDFESLTLDYNTSSGSNHNWTITFLTTADDELSFEITSNTESITDGTYSTYDSGDFDLDFEYNNNDDFEGQISITEVNNAEIQVSFALLGDDGTKIYGSYIGSPLNNSDIDLGGGGGGGSSTWPLSYSSISLDSWTYGTLYSSGETDYFRYSVTDGYEYTIYWDDSYSGSGNYTGDLMVSIFDSDGNLVAGPQDSGYNTGLSYTATESEYIYIKVEGYTTSSTGSYSVKLVQETSPCVPSNYYSLSSGSWTYDYLYSYETENYYRIYASSGYNYIYWDDSFSGSGSYTLDVRVTVYDSDCTEKISSMDSGYSGQSFYLSSSQYVYIKVEQYSSGTSGSYSVKFN